MSLRLGINTCFAVKRWPAPDEWAPIVADELGLEIVQHSLDLVDLGADDLDEQAGAVRGGVRRARARGALDVHRAGRLLANLLLHPDRRAPAAPWPGTRAIACTAALAARAPPAVTSAPVASRALADPARRAQRWDGPAGGARAAWRAEARDGRAGRARWSRTWRAAREPSTMAPGRGPARPRGDAEPRPIAPVPRRRAPVRRRARAATTATRTRGCAGWAPRAVVHLQQSDAEADHHWPFTAGRQRARAGSTPTACWTRSRPGARARCSCSRSSRRSSSADAAVLDDLRESVDYWREAL